HCRAALAHRGPGRGVAGRGTLPAYDFQPEAADEKALRGSRALRRDHPRRARTQAAALRARAQAALPRSRGDHRLLRADRLGFNIRLPISAFEGKTMNIGKRNAFVSCADTLLACCAISASLSASTQGKDDLTN